MIDRPDPSEHDEYYRRYIDLVPDGDVVDVLRRGVALTTSIVRGVPDDRAGEPYAAGKWSLKQLLAHLADTERVFTFRAFWFARRAPGDLAGMEQDDFVRESFAAGRSVESLVAELEAVRAATVALFDSLPREAAARAGVASGHSISVRAIPFITAGHEIHHRKQLRTVYRHVLEG
jgi:uncharacterized damage-inducible protein DinB